MLTCKYYIYVELDGWNYIEWERIENYNTEVWEKGEMREPSEMKNLNSVKFL